MTDGENLVELKPVVLTDAALIFESWGRRPENFTYLTAQVFASVSDAQRYIADLFSTRQSMAFHIVTPIEGVVGLIKASVAGHRARVGYVLDKRVWGRGFATSALRQLVVALEATSTLSRIWATCALDNPASARVLEKTGFVREAILKNWVTYPAQGGSAFDNYSYVRVPRDATRYANA
jgi:[ribosomal protein S5]-alanine N-acetyltransferase